MATALIKEDSPCFLTQEAAIIMKDWNVQPSTYHAIKSKQRKKEYLSRRMHRHVELCVAQVLEDSRWTLAPYVGLPDVITSAPDSSTSLFKQTRARILFDQHDEQNLKCNLCDCNHSGDIVHAIT